jgi:flagellar hook-basal body complex protein FliE
MNDVRVSELLAQMRTMSLQAQGKLPIGEVPEAGGSTFVDLLRNSVDAVNQTQVKAASLAQAFESGDPKVDLSEVMVAMQKANVSFQAMTQVRNKLVQAYQEIMNMPI